MASALPFPFERLPRMSRADARAASVLARLAASIDGQAALEDARRLLGAEVVVTATGWRLGEAQAIAAHLGEAIGLVASLGAERTVLAVAPGLARVVVDRVVGGAGTDVALGPTPLGRGEAGLLGYVVARMLRCAGSDAALVDAAQARDLVGGWGETRVVALSLGVRVGDAQGPATIVAPLAAAAAAVPPARGALDPSLPVRASLVIGAARLPASEIAALGKGDVVVPDELSMDPRLADVGRARLVVGRRRAYDVELEQGRVWRVARRASIPAPRLSGAWLRRKKEAPMSQPDTDPTSRADTVQSLGDVEIEVSIELARLEMPVPEVAALAPGVVVTTGRLTGERVALRAGDRVIAWGDLVDVEGEVGVRITEVTSRE